MLQRVQSIFLLGVGICMGLMLIFDIWQETDLEEGKQAVLNAYYLTVTAATDGENTQTTTEQGTWVIAIFAVLATITAFYEIFRYDNRLTQIKLGALNSLFMGAALGLSVWYSFEGEKIIDQTARGSYDIGFIFPCVALLLNVMANRFIRRDEKLVRSVDRLR
ncbi:DUF4293 domain-containing protein [Porifericola rhodea]|uniref:DUF4293 domain-containing protein n=1 Tax=Porifericola rhodea TaxID=930972 RepID=UPI0026655C10|nr:DUF4293 domain-containing protein [Porifericola rhodea]WKN33451.1 DUF4293 domain-containing protein [Porifericola rhodea]